MNITKIYLMRHGQSETNLAGVIGGQSDPDLTEEGRRQSEQAKVDMAHIKFDEVYSSHLQRAVKTAEIVSGTKVPKEHQLADLQERDYGSMEGKSDHHFADYIKALLTQHPDDRWAYRHVEDMENDHELSTRFIDALKTIGQRHTGKTVLVVAHGAAIRAAMIKLGYLTYEDLPPKSFKNTGFVELDYDGQQFVIHRLEGVDQKLVNDAKQFYKSK